MKIDVINQGITDGQTWSEIGVNPTFGQAYLYSLTARNELPNFAEVIWDYEIAEIITECKRFGIREFTVSSTFSNMVSTIAGFINQGCQLDGIVYINGQARNWQTGTREIIPAFKLSILI